MSAPAGGEAATIVLVSGLSGAGKSTILRTLEDIGFEAVDNPPLPLVEDMIARVTADGSRRVAIGVDARTHGFDADALRATLVRLQRACPALRLDLVYAWAEDAALLRRFTETRRRHPLALRGTVQDGIAAEQKLTAALREAADLSVDTTDLPVIDLKRLIEARYGGFGAGQPAHAGAGLGVTLVSFAFPAGLPRDADMVLDVRFLLNPHYVTVLKPKTGLDPDVGAYVESDPDYAVFFARVAQLIDLLLPRFVREGKKYATIAIGCTGGRHRSVHIVERLAAHLVNSNWRVTVVHRELALEGTRLPPADRSHGVADRQAPSPGAGGYQAQEA